MCRLQRSAIPERVPLLYLFLKSRQFNSIFTGRMETSGKRAGLASVVINERCRWRVAESLTLDLMIQHIVFILFISKF
jgi:hypothetical protein